MHSRGFRSAWALGHGNNERPEEQHDEDAEVPAVPLGGRRGRPRARAPRLFLPFFVAARDLNVERASSRGSGVSSMTTS